MAMAMPTRVLFVCMGNICRSPMAHGVFRNLVRQAGLGDVVTIDSAGTHGFHEGEPPDRRAQAAAARRGYDIADLRARKVVDQDFEDNDMILAMDWENLSMLQHQAHKRHHHKIQLLMRFAGEHESATIPDPYQATAQQAFDQVLDYLEDACSGLLEVARGGWGARRPPPPRSRPPEARRTGDALPGRAPAAPCGNCRLRSAGRVPYA
jgi:protein-tyrosine phosphatase